MNVLIKYKKYFLIILIIGFAAYFPIFFNGPAWDDGDFIFGNAQVHQLNLPVLFGPSLFNSYPFYRPIPALYFAILYSLFGQLAFFYHILQLTLHLVNTFLLFFLFCLFFSEGISFFLALLFLIHPIQVESVANIASTVSELYFFFGITGFLLATQKQLNKKTLITISILLLLSVLTKEAGILFLPLIIAYRYFFKLFKLKEFILSGIVIGTIYLFFRIVIGHVTYVEDPYLIPIALLPFSARLINIPAIILYYLKTFVFPLKLAHLQIWIVRTITIKEFIIPLLIICLFFMVLLNVIYLLYKHDYRYSIQEVKQKKNKRLIEQKKFQQLVFFLLWFVLGISIILQLVPLEMTVSDRWFYFPIVGVLGMIGVMLMAIQPSYTRHKNLYIWGAIILLIMLSLRTFIRTFDWKDDFTLNAHDVREEPDNSLLLYTHGKELFSSGKIDEACGYIKKSALLSPSATNLNALGGCYQIKKKYNEAIIEYTRAINLYKSEKYHITEPTFIYLNKAKALFSALRTTEAVDLLNNQAIKEFPDESEPYRILAIMESVLGNHQKALDAATHAYKLSHDPSTTRVYYHISNNMPISNWD